MILRFLARLFGKIGLHLTKMAKAIRGVGLEGDKQFSFRNVVFEMCISYPSSDFKQAVECKSRI